MNIVMVPHKSIRPAEWRTNHVLKPDLDLLRVSLTECGWLYPILVNNKNSIIIDGFHRWMISQEPKVAPSLGDAVPVVFVDVDDIDAMVLHVRLNRARGSIVAKRLSNLVKAVLASKKYSEQELEKILLMSPDEVDLMLDGSLVKRRRIKEYQYSKAWVPVEAPSGTEILHPTIERPPNRDGQ